MTEMDDRRQRALRQVEIAAQMRLEADQLYEDAVMNASDLGCGNTVIARRIGVTETSIRLYIKRRKGDE